MYKQRKNQVSVKTHIFSTFDVFYIMPPVAAVSHHKSTTTCRITGCLGFLPDGEKDILTDIEREK